ncbi:acid sphingomyelinase-like phosphodiesterase 3a [Plutella xylostella]|uniref:acid sphingomyelinase-like phosphodiesterase 3a n=1 Tax=Plutella xylostella TaxID=51655 RepID=UPI002032F594|nr:acid sphingomyelinase-like phosphodiesterase 3a [Plutella xylostella]
MRAAHLVLTLTSVISFTCTHAKIGYFWHITDFHYDPLYTSKGDTRRHCRRADERGSSGHHRTVGRFGDFACDSPLELIESAAKHMRTRHAENVEFVLWTGDITVARSTTELERYQAIRNMTELLSRTFSSHFVFPVLGHLDPAPSENLTNLWMHWLPLEALQTFKIGGYYTIEQSHSKLRIVALNTNLFSGRDASSPAAGKQWAWLSAVLEKAQDNNEMVYIVGHAPPGPAARPGHRAYSPEDNARYLRTVRRFARGIAGQFFGHLHEDTFRVVYDNDQPVSWALLAPSVSPYAGPASATNPRLRLYKFDTNTGKVLDYTQYSLDLTAANRAGTAEWVTEYNMTTHYALPDISPASLHALADRLRYAPHETMTFNKYLRAFHSGSSEACDGACAHQHYCAITCLEHLSYRQCVEAAASALAAAGDSAPLVAPLNNIVLTLIVLLAICLEKYLHCVMH